MHTKIPQRRSRARLWRLVDNQGNLGREDAANRDAKRFPGSISIRQLLGSISIHLTLRTRVCFTLVLTPLYTTTLFWLWLYYTTLRTALHYHRQSAHECIAFRIAVHVILRGEDSSIQPSAQIFESIFSIHCLQVDPYFPLRHAVPVCSQQLPVVCDRPSVLRFSFCRASLACAHRHGARCHTYVTRIFCCLPFRLPAASAHRYAQRHRPLTESKSAGCLRPSVRPARCNRSCS